MRTLWLLELSLVLVLLVGCPADEGDDDATGDDDTAGPNDADQDGFNDVVDCNDDDPQSWPGAPELCDGLDNDCDEMIPETEIDDDGDGMSECEGDCDDTDAATFDGAEEVCDGEDNDCDEVVPDDELDEDGDGVSACEGDCDDEDDEVFPGATESCNTVDDNCDGVVDEGFDADGDGYTECEGDCDDSNAEVFPGATEVCDEIDNDCDGSVAADEVDDDLDGVLVCEGDCDDSDDSVYPGADEGCDGLDTDCDGSPAADEVDADFDGYRLCDDDCDDGDSAINPGATEVCDSADNDCDGTVDNEGSFGCDDYYRDGDGDGWGDAADTQCLCDAVAPYTVVDAGDCDDGNPFIYPGQAEDCNAVDDDCDGVVPADEVDGDADGQMICDGDCDDADSTVYLFATELCDGLDNDCNGTLPTDETDGDGDGWMTCNGDCDTDDAGTFPGAAEQCDGLDNDCDGVPDVDEVDGDGDGWMVCENDCDDGEPLLNPGRSEGCNGVDDNCDGIVPADEMDVDGDGEMACAGDCDDGDADVHTGATEVCDGQDNDCDGALLPLEADDDGDGWMICEDDCDDENADTYLGAVEQCDGLDNSCDGVTPADEDDLDGDGWMVCEDDCDDGDAGANPGEVEAQGDGVDNDCDGAVDEPDILAPIGAVNAADAHAKLLGEYNEDYAGTSSAGVGDVDDDGYDDFLVSASGSDRGGPSTGCVYLMHGPVSGTMSLSVADAFMVGGDAETGATGLIAAGGDIDGDGETDFLIAARNYDYNYTNQGAIFVVYGPVSGTYTLSEADGMLLGETDYDMLGNWPFTGAGDVNGDGYDDVLVGNENANGVRGKAYLVYGPISAGRTNISSADAIFEGAYNDHAGDSVGLGDVNGDGFDDVYTGAPGYAQSGFLFYGGTGGSELQGTYSLASDADATFTSSNPDDWGTGDVGTTFGDIDGDGTKDILMGDPYNGDDYGDYRGVVHLVQGSLGQGPRGNTDVHTDAYRISGTAVGQQVGYMVTSPGDINADGYDDILFGAVGNGGLHLVYGPLTASITLDDVDAWFVAEHAGDYFGAPETVTGDINGDGYDDILAGATRDDEAYPDAGAAYLFLGGTGP